MSGLGLITYFLSLCFIMVFFYSSPKEPHRKPFGGKLAVVQSCVVDVIELAVL